MALPTRADAIFFLSGGAALVYQVVWMRLLVRQLGSEAAAVGVVLAVFMLGLGGGSILGGELARRTRTPHRWFAALGLAIALWAGLTPRLLEPLPLAASFPGRLALAALVLLPPTLGMGATFPLMARLLDARGRALAGRVASFYGANTLGAAFGALAAPFLFMPRLGLAGALWAGAAADALAAIGALLWLAPRPSASAAVPTTGRSALTPGRAAAAAALLGAVGIGLEVVLTRLFVTLTGASVYAFALVLFAFLVGLGLGARQARTWLAHDADDLLFRCAAWLPAATAVGLLLLRWRSDWIDLFGPLENYQIDASRVEVMWFGHGILMVLALLWPTVALGAALPAATVCCAASASPERGLGRLYAANTFGAAGGGALAAFVLIPSVGPRGALFALGALALAAAAVVSRRPRELGLAAVVGTAGFLALGVGAPPRPGVETVEQRHGLDSTALVQVDHAGGGHRLLRIQGKVVATTAPVDLRLQRLLGHVPAQLHGEVKTALVIGLGTGMTAGSLLDGDALRELRIVELSSAVAEVAGHFADVNGDVLNDPRTELILADGRHRLRLDDRRYDLITADPIHPWTRGSSDLYCLEHFESLAAHLAPGGIASQWLPLYQLSDEDVRVVVATWAAAFPRVSAWLTAYDLVLVGSHAHHGGAADLSAGELSERTARALAEAGVHGLAGLAALQVADDERLRAWAQGVEPMTEDLPVLEFRAPRSYLAGYSEGTLRWAAAPESLATLPDELRPHGEALRACTRRFLAALPEGWSSAARAYGEELLALPPPAPDRL